MKWGWDRSMLLEQDLTIHEVGFELEYAFDEVYIRAGTYFTLSWDLPSIKPYTDSNVVLHN